MTTFHIAYPYIDDFTRRLMLVLAALFILLSSYRSILKMFQLLTILSALLTCGINNINGAVLSSMGTVPAVSTVEPTPTLPTCSGSWVTCQKTITIESTATPTFVTSTLLADTTVLHLIKRSVTSSIKPTSTEVRPAATATLPIPVQVDVPKNKTKKWSVAQKTKGAVDYMVNSLKKIVTYGVGILMTPIAYVNQG